MQVKFEFEDTAESITIDHFADTLLRFCVEAIDERYHGVITDEVPRLYEQKALVHLLNRWEVQRSLMSDLFIHDLSDSETYQLLSNEHDSLTWLIAEMF